MTASFKRKQLAQAIAMASAVMALDAIAQPQDNRATVLEEVLVTAQKIEESLQDTPISVAAFDRESLTLISASEAGDIANYTPNMTMRKQSASQDNYAIGIRGVASGETALAIDPTVGIYQDGVYIARSTGAAFDIVDLQRIEVLRGPQGTLYGRNTIGGAINVITEKPRGEFAFQQTATYGNRGNRQFRTTVDTPEKAGLAAKISYLNTSKDGHLKSSISGGELGQAQRRAYRIAVSMSPSETTSIDVIYDNSNSESNSSFSQLSGVRASHQTGGVVSGGAYFDAAATFADPKRRSSLPLPNDDDVESTSDIDGVSAIITHELNEKTTVKAILSRREWESTADGTNFGSIPAPSDNSLIDFSGQYAGFAQPVAPGTLVPLFSASRVSDQVQKTIEIQVLGTLFDDRVNYIVGYYNFEEQANEVNPQQFVLAGPTLGNFFTPDPSDFFPANTSYVLASPGFAYGTDNSSEALFGQYTYHWSVNTDLTLGIRYTEDTKSTYLVNPPGISSRIDDTQDYENFSPDFTVDHRFSEEVAVYFRWANGYRSGGYNVRAASEAIFRQPFDEESLQSFELGVKSDLFNRTLRLNASAFHLQYTDRQIAQFTAGSGGASTNIVNAGESETSGIELDFTWLAMRGLRVSGGYGYLDVKIKEFVTAPVNPATGLPSSTTNQDIAGNGALENVYAPEHTGYLALDYTFAPSSYGQWGMRIDGTHSEAISFHPQLKVLDEAGSRTLVNARATLSDINVGDNAALTLALWSRNLTNEEYRDFGIDFGSLGFAINNYGMLNSYGIDLTYQINPR